MLEEALNAKMAELEGKIMANFEKKLEMGGPSDVQASVKKQAEFTGMGLLDADDFDIQLDGNLPEKFKMPDLAKFDGVASSWYHGLEATVRKDWEELVRRFVQQYSYNTALDVTLRDLETTRQKPNETFSEYLLRWRKKAMKMTNRPAEKDQVRLVVKSLQPSYYEKLCYYPLATFEQLYDAGVLVEDVLNNEKKSYQPKRGGYQSAGNITGENKVIEVQTVSRTPRKFSQFNQPLSKDLIDAKKIVDPENRPNTRTNPMPNHNVPPPPGLYMISTTSIDPDQILNLIQPIQKLDEPRSVMTIDIWDSSSDEEGLLDVWVDSDGEEKSRVSHMTKSGGYYPDPPMEKDNVRGKAKVLAEEDTYEEDDQFLRQLKRTQASV
ncbi:hypothetical protein P3X46_016897 [Hevea brasiliensis]|uniref:Retrotransposon gag domain-containing protein n=1 Tax=Hevea brasiliensis TaxID=3981 RepID=A0ABQ9M1R6_HEVBR|nr:hypothetical protein P3X46_016897 [Hevea brasiliensis]